MAFGKKFTMVLILLLVVTLLAGCAQEKKAPPKTEKQPLKIGVLPIEDIMPMVVAEKNGYFTQENLQVELIRFQSAVEQGNAMQSGQLNGMVTDMIVATLMKDTGLDLKMTSITLGATPQEGRFAIVAAPGSTIKTLADLKGKSLGISHNSIIEYVSDGLLKDAGIDPSEVKKTSVPKIPLRMEMLFNKQIDAITVPDPMVTFAEFKGATVIAQDTTRNLSQAVILFDQKTLDEKKAAVAGFYRAYAKAVEDLNNHPDQYKQLMVKNVNIPEPIAKDYSLQRYPKPQVPTEEDVNNILQWMSEKKLLKKDLKYPDLVQKI
ncbi:ABC transporter substrate-binding protein [Desulforamulus aeronauticus]|uniref:NitT/TauT family transport system substrate-binding protein n=1 Tax=Desulforamulus aeronauticus DSM 10349 TaxID=1121421 RepID=A0A1M6S3J4_9FIRM|nr:MetQ/NlpA family ABC transporter substrate-binding protein [Desulforamulus aeronauticus]SHK39098.1 NitT/TauT family transport system substrate-binding protein [Desulforamulus aeronauticus DSM 10349]